MQLLPERPVEERVGLLAVLKQERQVDQPEILQAGNADQGRGVRNRHLLRSALERRDHRHVVSERAAGEKPDLDLALALLATISANFVTDCPCGWSALRPIPTLMVRSRMSAATGGRDCGA